MDGERGNSNDQDGTSNYLNHIISFIYNGGRSELTATTGGQGGGSSSGSGSDNIDNNDNLGHLIRLLKLIILMTLTAVIVVKWIISATDWNDHGTCEQECIIRGDIDDIDDGDIGMKQQKHFTINNKDDGDEGGKIVNQNGGINSRSSIKSDVLLSYRKLKNSGGKGNDTKKSIKPLLFTRHVHFADDITNTRVPLPKKDSSKMSKNSKIMEENSKEIKLVDKVGVGNNEWEEDEDYVIFDSEGSNDENEPDIDSVKVGSKPSKSQNTKRDDEQCKLNDVIVFSDDKKKLAPGHFDNDIVDDNAIIVGDGMKLLYVKCVADTCPKTVMKLVYDRDKELDIPSNNNNNIITRSIADKNSDLQLDSNSHSKKSLNYFLPLYESQQTAFVPKNTRSRGDEDDTTSTSPPPFDVTKRGKAYESNQLRSPTFITTSSSSSQPIPIDPERSVPYIGQPVPAVPKLSPKPIPNLEYNTTHAQIDHGEHTFETRESGEVTSPVLEGASHNRASTSRSSESSQITTSVVRELITPFTCTPFREEIIRSSVCDKKDRDNGSSNDDSPLLPDPNRQCLDPSHDRNIFLNRKFDLEIVENRPPTIVPQSPLEHDSDKTSPNSSAISASPSPTHSTCTTLSIELSPGPKPLTSSSNHCNVNYKGNNGFRRNLKFQKAPNTISDDHYNVPIDSSLEDGECLGGDYALVSQARDISDRGDRLKAPQLYKVEAQSRAICTVGCDNTADDPEGTYIRDPRKYSPSVAKVKAYGSNPFLALARATAHAATIASAKAAFETTGNAEVVKRDGGDCFGSPTIRSNAGHSDVIRNDTNEDLTILVSTSCTIRNMDTTDPSATAMNGGEDLLTPHLTARDKVKTLSKAIHDSFLPSDPPLPPSSTSLGIIEPCNATDLTCPVITYDDSGHRLGGGSPPISDKGDFILNGSSFEKVIKDMKRVEDDEEGYTLLAQNHLVQHRSNQNHSIKPILVKTGSSPYSSNRLHHDVCNGRHITLSPRVIEHEIPYEDRAGNWLPGPENEEEDEEVNTKGEVGGDINNTSFDSFNSANGLVPKGVAKRTQIKIIDRNTEPDHLDNLQHSIHSSNPPLDEIAKQHKHPREFHHHDFSGADHKMDTSSMSKEQTNRGDVGTTLLKSPKLDSDQKLSKDSQNEPIAVNSPSDKSSSVVNKDVILPNKNEETKKDKLYAPRQSKFLSGRSHSEGNVAHQLFKIWDKIPKKSFTTKYPSQTNKVSTDPEILKRGSLPKVCPNTNDTLNKIDTKPKPVVSHPKSDDSVKNIKPPQNSIKQFGTLETINPSSKPPLPNGHVPKTSNVIAKTAEDTNTNLDTTTYKNDFVPTHMGFALNRSRDIVSPSKALINKLKSKYMTPLSTLPTTDQNAIVDSNTKDGLSLSQMGAFDRAITRYRSHSRSSLTPDSVSTTRNQLFKTHPAMRSLLSKSMGDLSAQTEWSSTFTAFNKLPSPSNPAISEAHKTFDRLIQASMTKLNSTNRGRRHFGKDSSVDWDNVPFSSTHRSMSMGNVLFTPNPQMIESDDLLLKSKIVGETDIDEVFKNCRRESDVLKGILFKERNDSEYINTSAFNVPFRGGSAERDYGQGETKGAYNFSNSQGTTALLAKLKDSTSTLDLPSWMSRSSLSSYQEHSKDDSTTRRPFSRTSLIVMSGDESGIAELQSDPLVKGKKRVRYRSGDFRKVDVSFSDSSSCLESQSNACNKDSSFEHERDVFDDVIPPVGRYNTYQNSHTIPTMFSSPKMISENRLSHKPNPSYKPYSVREITNPERYVESGDDNFKNGLQSNKALGELQFCVPHLNSASPTKLNVKAFVNNIEKKNVEKPQKLYNNLSRRLDAGNLEDPEFPDISIITTDHLDPSYSYPMTEGKYDLPATDSDLSFLEDEKNTSQSAQPNIMNTSFSEDNENSFVLVLNNPPYYNGDAHDVFSPPKKFLPLDHGKDDSNTSFDNDNSPKENEINYESSSVSGEDKKVGNNFKCRSKANHDLEKPRPRILKLKTETRVKLSSEESYNNNAFDGTAATDEQNEKESNNSMDGRYTSAGSHSSNAIPFDSAHHQHQHPHSTTCHDVTHCHDPQKVSSYNSIWSRAKLDQSNSSTELLCDNSYGISRNYESPPTSTVTHNSGQGNNVQHHNMEHYPDYLYAKEEYYSQEMSPNKMGDNYNKKYVTNPFPHDSSNSSYDFNGRESGPKSNGLQNSKPVPHKHGTSPNISKQNCGNNNNKTTNVTKEFDTYKDGGGNNGVRNHPQRYETPV